MVVIWCFAQPQNEDFSFDTDLVEIDFFLYRIEIYLWKWCYMILFAGALQRNCIRQ